MASSYSSEEVASALRHAIEIKKILDEHPDDLVSTARLERISKMLEIVNYSFFALVAWVLFAWLAPILNGDDRPTWFLWLVVGPIAGFFFGGLGGLIAWNVFAMWLGRFWFDRQRDSESARLWERLITGSWKPVTHRPSWAAKRDASDGTSED